MNAPDTVHRGPVAWMAANPVAANLLMGLFIVGGMMFAGSVRQEVMPEVDLDLITVSVAYPGASPSEVEEGIVLAVEEEIRGVDGVKKVSSTASEGMGIVSAELLLGADSDRALSDIKAAVDRITSFPQDAERPIVSLATSRQQVLNIVLYGDLDVHQLHDLSEAMRTELLHDPVISLVETAGLPPPEISIEVSQEELRRYGLTLDEIARLVGAASIDLPGGAVKTPGGEVLLRTTERREFGEEFANITIVSSRDGTRVRLGDIAKVVDGFRDSDTEAYYDGLPAAMLEVYRTGEESPLDVAAAVRKYIDVKEGQLPAGVGLTITNDQSKIFRDRINLLLRNGQLGALLVLLVLGVFLQPKLAFWVTLGIPICFFGAFLFMPGLGVSINMISLFAFILTLGIVVDDAVVVGEAVYTHRAQGKDPLTAAIDGAREVLTPVVFAVLTTVIAFSPLLFVPGVMGKFFSNIPMIVIPVLLLSLVESLFILPAHLSHVSKAKDGDHWRWTGWILGQQKRFSNWMERMIAERYVPLLRRVVAARYLTLAISVAVLIVAGGMVAGGRLAFSFMPEVENDQVDVGISMPFGTPVEETRAVMQRLVEGARQTAAQIGEEMEGAEGLLLGIYAEIGRSSAVATGDISIDLGTASSHKALVSAYLAPAGERPIGAEVFAQRWRTTVGDIPGIDRLSFTYSLSVGAGAAIDIQLSHEDVATVEVAAQQLAADVASYGGVFDIDDGIEAGKTQLDLELKPAARSLGLSERELASQVRAAFYGAEADRQQRGRDELRVYARLPENQRRSLYFVENLVIRTPAGGEIPLQQAASITESRSYTSIRRRDGKRVISVTADVDDSIANSSNIVGDLRSRELPALLAATPGLSYSFGGEQEAQAESLGGLAKGLVFALIAMYALMAVAFRSYVQPVLILMAIPFGLIGAVAGHMLMGYDLSMVSALGLVALSGVVINDSLVLVYAIDGRREEGVELVEAIVSGAARRVRPVLLTSLTTFFGLAPMMFETSLQARFLIPMALSLGFGVLMVTSIALLLIPASYLILEDGRARLRGLRQEVAPA